MSSSTCSLTGRMPTLLVLSLMVQNVEIITSIAVQNFSAVVNPQISAIITRNTKDFKDSSLEVVDSVEFLNSK